jgi:hypothetical protein
MIPAVSSGGRAAGWPRKWAGRKTNGCANRRSCRVLLAAAETGRSFITARWREFVLFISAGRALGVIFDSYTHTQIWPIVGRFGCLATTPKRTMQNINMFLL